jgi:hypothetical protein
LTERFRLRLRESFIALLAFPTLHFLGSIESSFDQLDTAVVARHFGLAFFGPMEPK